MLPFALEFSAFTDAGFWVGVGVFAGTYVLLALGLQLNVGFTGISNFGQAGFMAVGAYTMGVLTVESGFSFWLALPLSIIAAMLFGILVGLPSLRLREDYFAITTLAAAEVVRISARNLKDVTNGSEGLSCSQTGDFVCFDDTWRDVSDGIESFLQSLGWSDPESLIPLLLVVWGFVIVLTIVLKRITDTPWGRVLRAVREDEDAARALGKNPLVYKLQSLAIAAAIAAVAGWFLAFNIASIAPTEFLPIFTFFAYAVLILGGLASYWGLIVGSAILWTLLEATRFIELPIDADQEAALRYAIVGLVIILLMAFRPQGMFGKREEMVLGE
ncbi:MAG TPA: branched-chain amino acid ABC transporter permease [Solirubrobacterales bacterium]|nr:branched-chain amino acid ABC transporter permease [Solirubrobacterales bacterium]